MLVRVCPPSLRTKRFVVYIAASSMSVCSLAVSPQYFPLKAAMNIKMNIDICDILSCSLEEYAFLARTTRLIWLAIEDNDYQICCKVLIKQSNMN